MSAPIVNSFFWYDVMTTDTAAATKFYTDVVGWRAQESGSPGYTALTVDGVGTAGLMAVPEDAAKMGARPCWMGYILVDDVAAKCAEIKAAGGRVEKGPITIDGIITFAVAADPQGGGFLIAKPIPDKPVNWPAAGTPGTVGWHELMAGDWEKVWPFYENLFGWKKGAALDMGPMGVYQLFSNQDGQVGGMMSKPSQMPVAAWAYYFQVGQIDAAADRVKAAGGQILNGPMEVPGGGWIVRAMDPQGAMFALFGSKV